MSEVAIFRAINDVSNRCSNLSEFILKIQSRIQEDENKISKISENEECLIERVEKLEKCLEVRHKVQVDIHTEISNRIHLLGNEVKSLKEDLTNLRSFFTCIQEDLKKCKETIISFHEHFANSIEVKIFSLRAELEETMVNLPKPKIPSSEEISSAIQLKVEPVSIDAKNACLRSANNDMRLGLAEKKIEQLFLLLQKHSISAG